MASSYREEVNKYKTARAIPIEDAPMPHVKKKKRKKNKKSNHKHIYSVPVVVREHDRFSAFGFCCEVCGKIQNMNFIFSFNEENFEQFKKDNPDYQEIILDKGVNIFDLKYI